MGEPLQVLFVRLVARGPVLNARQGESEKERCKGNAARAHLALGLAGHHGVGSAGGRLMHGKERGTNKVEFPPKTAGDPPRCPEHTANRVFLFAELLVSTSQLLFNNMVWWW